MTKRELVARVSERIAEAERIGALAPVASVLRAFLDDLEALDGVPTAPPTEDVLLTLGQAAERLQVDVRWFTLHRGELPFVRTLSKNTVRVSSRGLARWLDAQRAA